MFVCPPAMGLFMFNGPFWSSKIHDLSCYRVFYGVSKGSIMSEGTTMSEGFTSKGFLINPVDI